MMEILNDYDVFGNSLCLAELLRLQKTEMELLWTIK